MVRVPSPSHRHGALLVGASFLWVLFAAVLPASAFLTLPKSGQHNPSASHAVARSRCSNTIDPYFFVTTSNRICSKRTAHASNRRRGATLKSTSVSETATRTDNDEIKSPPPALLSALMLFVLDILFRRVFQFFSITFPSSLAGCGILFVTLLSLSANKAQFVFRQLQPGAALLAKWLPVFFVPSLVTLPLSQGLGSFLEYFKVGLVVCGGFLFTLLTTSLSVVLVRQFYSAVTQTKNKQVQVEAVSTAIASKIKFDDDDIEKSEPATDRAPSDNPPAEVASAEAPYIAVNEESNATMSLPKEEPETADTISQDPELSIHAKIQTATESKPVALPTILESVSKRPFSDQTLYSLLGLSTATFAAGIVASAMSSPYRYLLRSICFLFATLGSFVSGTRLPKTFTKLVHPLITCTTITWTAMATFGLLTTTRGLRSFRQMLRIYRTGRVDFLGAGDLLLFCLGPAVVSLAISMYERRLLMKENLSEVGVAIGVSTMGGVFGTAALVRFLEIGEPTVRLALLSRNITSPLAMAIAGILGADVSLAVSMVVVTGLLGANFGASILSLFGINDAVARGLGMGAAAHGLGTAAIVNEKDAFPFAAIAMALTASAATITVSIPLFRRMILQLALGY